MKQETRRLHQFGNVDHRRQPNHQDAAQQDPTTPQSTKRQSMKEVAEGLNQNQPGATTTDPEHQGQLRHRRRRKPFTDHHTSATAKPPSHRPAQPSSTSNDTNRGKGKQKTIKFRLRQPRHSSPPSIPRARPISDPHHLPSDDAIVERCAVGRANLQAKKTLAPVIAERLRRGIPWMNLNIEWNSISLEFSY